MIDITKSTQVRITTLDRRVPTTWLQNFPVSGLMPMTEVPVKINSGFQGRGKNFITIVHLVVISYGPVYSSFVRKNRHSPYEIVAFFKGDNVNA